MGLNIYFPLISWPQQLGADLYFGLKINWHACKLSIKFPCYITPDCKEAEDED